ALRTSGDLSAQSRTRIVDASIRRDLRTRSNHEHRAWSALDEHVRECRAEALPAAAADDDQVNLEARRDGREGRGGIPGDHQAAALDAGLGGHECSQCTDAPLALLVACPLQDLLWNALSKERPLRGRQYMEQREASPVLAR